MCEDHKDVIEEEEEDSLVTDSDKQISDFKSEKKKKKVIGGKVQMFSQYFQKEIAKLKIMFLCGVSKRRQSSPFEDCEKYTKIPTQGTKTCRRTSKTLRKKNIKLVKVFEGTNPKIKIVNCSKSEQSVPSRSRKRVATPSHILLKSPHKNGSISKRVTQKRPSLQNVFPIPIPHKHVDAVKTNPDFQQISDCLTVTNAIQSVHLCSCSNPCICDIAVSHGPARQHIALPGHMHNNGDDVHSSRDLTQPRVVTKITSEHLNDYEKVDTDECEVNIVTKLSHLANEAVDGENSREENNQVEKDLMKVNITNIEENSDVTHRTDNNCDNVCRHADNKALVINDKCIRISENSDDRLFDENDDVCDERCKMTDDKVQSTEAESFSESELALPLPNPHPIEDLPPESELFEDLSSGDPSLTSPSLDSSSGPPSITLTPFLVRVLQKVGIYSPVAIMAIDSPDLAECLMPPPPSPPLVCEPPSLPPPPLLCQDKFICEVCVSVG